MSFVLKNRVLLWLFWLLQLFSLLRMFRLLRLLRLLRLFRLLRLLQLFRLLLLLRLLRLLRLIRLFWLLWLFRLLWLLRLLRLLRLLHLFRLLRLLRLFRLLRLRSGSLKRFVWSLSSTRCGPCARTPCFGCNVVVQNSTHIVFLLWYDILSLEYLNHIVEIAWVVRSPFATILTWLNA